MTQRRSTRFDDEDFDDIYDPRFFPRKVVRDGGRVRVPLALTDGMPDRTPPGRAVFDARNHRPRFAVLGDAELQDARRRAAEARQEDIARISNAWRGPGNPPPPPLRDGQSPRDQYIAYITSAWKTPIGQAVSGPDDDDDPNPIEAQRRRWLSPGATPGPGPGYRDARPAVSRETATRDAAGDRDQAYGEYVDRISNAWRAR
jgi:hypothetical protein